MAVAYDSLFHVMKARKITGSDLMRQAKISGNIVARLKHNRYVSLETVENICRVLQCDVGDVLKFDFPRKNLGEYYGDSELPTKIAEIQNRRYLGNKFKLLDFIGHTVEKKCPNVESIADIFAGTGAVSSAFKDKIIITNDLLACNYFCNVAWFDSEKIRLQMLKNLIDEYNGQDISEENYMTENFSDTYFSRKDCSKIGFVRENIEKKFDLGQINERERAALIASLIYAMDRIANTCGHYDAYRKGVEFERNLILPMLNLPAENRPENRCFNTDANKLVSVIQADLIYIDPPYNSRQYSDTYHVLENVARWQKTPVYGIARKMNRKEIKSDYCTSKATAAFENLIRNIDAKYILLSYNNMANKGNDRSNARIADEDIFRILENRGKVEVFSKKYRAFSAGKSDIRENEERLFLCKVRN